MSAGKMSERRRHEEIDRRSWLRRAVAGRGGVRLCRWSASGRESRPETAKLSPAEEAEQELERAQARVKAVTRRPLLTSALRAISSRR